MSSTVTVTTDQHDTTDLTLDNSVEDQVTASTPDVTNNGDYRWQVRESGEGQAWGAVAETTTGHDDVDAVFTSLEDGEQYDVRVRTETEHVTGSWFTASTVTVLPAPTNFAATEQNWYDYDNRTIPTSWTDNSDHADEEYYLVYSTDGGSTWSTTADLGTDTTSHNFSAGQDGTKYTLKARVATEHSQADSGTDTAIVPVDSGTGYWAVVHRDGQADTRLDHLKRPDPVRTHTAKSDFELSIPYNESLEARILDEIYLYYADSLLFRGFVLDVTSDEAGLETILGGPDVVYELESSEATVTYQDIATHEAISDYWTNHTPWTATVQSPSPTEIVTDETVLDLTSTADFSGAFVIPDDVPAEAAGDELHAIQACWPFDCLDDDDSTWGSTTFDNGDQWNDGQVLTIQGDNQGVAFEFTPGYNILAENVGIKVRGEIENESNLNFRFYEGPASDVTGNGSGTIFDEAVSTSGVLRGWHDIGAGTFSGGSKSYESSVGTDLSAGSTYTVIIEGDSSTNDANMDVIAVFDDRESFTFPDPDAATNGGGVLDAPEPMPDAVPVVTSTDPRAYNITEATVDASFDDTSASQAVAASNDDGATYQSYANAADGTLTFPDPGTQFVLKVTLSRYGSRSTFPATGFKGQSLQDVAVTLDGDDLSVIDDWTLTGSDLDNLIALHEHAGYRFVPSYDESTRTVESFPTGSIVKSPSWEAKAYSRRINARGYANKVVVRGAADGQGGQYTATQTDDSEISTYGEHVKKVSDDSITSHAAAVYRASSELGDAVRKRNMTGRITIFPELVEPGYSYTVSKWGEDVALEEVQYGIQAGDAQGTLRFDLDPRAVEASLAELRSDTQDF